MISYFSGLRTIDLLGLTEPAARPFLARGDYAWAIREFPTFVFVPDGFDTWPIKVAISHEPIFNWRYRPIARFPYLPGLDYVIYTRDDVLGPAAGIPRRSFDQAAVRQLL
jgi:hypothetical protein